MAVRDHIQNRKVRAKILTVDPATRKVEALLSDGALVQVAIYETPAFFRWPTVDEFWTLYYENGLWTLGHPMETLVTDSFTIEDSLPGEARVDVNTVRNPAGSMLIHARHYNVRDYGAVGDGSIDDQPAIEAAILEARNNATYTYFPPGRYRCAVDNMADGPIEVQSNDHLYGSGKDSVILRTTGDRPILNATTELHNFSLRDLVFDYNGVENTTGSGWILKLNPPSGGSNVVIDHIEIHKTPFASFALTLDNIDGLTVTNNYLDMLGRDGIHLTGCHNGLVAGNVIKNSGQSSSNSKTGSGIGDDNFILGNCEHITLYGNVAWCPHMGRGRNLWLVASRHITVIGNVFYGGWRSNVTLENDFIGGSDPTEDIIIANNVLNSAGVWNNGASFGNSIHIHSSNQGGTGFGPIKRVLIDGNTILNPRRHGIRIQCDGNPSRIEHIRIRDNQQWVDRALTHYDLTGNFVHCDISAVPSAIVSDLEISGNRSQETYLEAIRLKGASGNIKRVRVSNEVHQSMGQTSATTDGYYFEQIEGLVMDASEVRDIIGSRTNYGARFTNITGRVRIVDNDFEDTIQHRVLWTGATPATYIKGSNWGSGASDAGLP